MRYSTCVPVVDPDSDSRLSVVVLNYNHGRFLADQLAAILAQSYSPLEVIVIDDASTDDSVAIIERFAATDARLRLERNDVNRGANYGHNRGVELASSEFVYIGAADDVVLPGFFQRSMRMLEQHPEAGLCSSRTRLIDEQGADLGTFPTPVVSRTPRFLAADEVASLLQSHGSWFMGNATVYRRRALVEAGGFRAELASFADGFVSQVLALKHGACFDPGVFTTWRRMAGGFSAGLMADRARADTTFLHAAHLMRTTYGEWFPDAYVDPWLRRQLLSVRNVELLARRTRRVGRAGRKVGKVPAIGGLLVALAKTTFALVYYASAAYLVSRQLGVREGALLLRGRVRRQVSWV